MRQFGYMRGDLRSKGQLTGDPDLLIAATALQHGLTLLSHNTRHFSRIPGLRVEDIVSSSSSAAKTGSSGMGK